MVAEHLAVAERICYDGTPAPSERRWAEENGWEVREFTITKEAATGLLDRGIPFTLTTVDPGNAHLQAMIGYDGRRGTFILRDPYERNWGEADQEEFLKHYRSSGPRGMAMAPKEKEPSASLTVPIGVPLPSPRPVESVEPAAVSAEIAPTFTSDGTVKIQPTRIYPRR